MIRTLRVFYCGWGEDWLLGQLASDGQKVLFEYSQEALRQGLELSPLRLPLAPRTYGDFPHFLNDLPGLINDALPDGWGLLMMDRLFRQQGMTDVGPLERLAFIGDRGMGALRFEPVAQTAQDLPDWSLYTLARQSQQLITDTPGVALRQLVLTGGSPQGARPKALVQYDVQHQQVSTLPDASGEPWLVKFPSQGEPAEVCALEELYARLARACGLDMPPSAFFELPDGLTAFGVQRFDRQQGMRVPVHSLAGLLQVDFRVVGSLDYLGLLRATRVLTRDVREVEKAYARVVFNVLFHNRDDHAKNFAWCLGRDRQWRLAPAFDLTLSDGPNGEHHLDVMGHGKNITRQMLMALAQKSDLSARFATRCMDQMLEQTGQLQALAQGLPLSSTHLRDIRNRWQTGLLQD